MRLSSALWHCLVAGFLLILGSHSPGFAQQLSKELTSEQKEKLKESRRFSKESSALEKEGKLREAIAAAEKMLRIERGVFGDVHADVVGSLQRLARMHERLEEFAPAQKERQEILALQNKLLGKQAWQVVDARLDLKHVELLMRLDAKERQELKEAQQLMDQALACHKPGKYQQGVAYAEKALAIRLRIVGEDSLLFLRSVQMTWMCWQSAGQLKKARPYVEQALSICRKLFGENHPETIRTLIGMSRFRHEQGDYAGALTQAEQALAVSKKVWGPDHYQTYLCLGVLGDALSAQGDYVAARRSIEERIVVGKKLKIDKEATSLARLGSLLESQGDYAGARQCYEQVLAIRKKVLGEDDPQTAQTLHDLGNTLLSEGKDYAGAQTYFEQAMAIRKNAFGEHHLKVASSLNDLGYLLLRQEDYAGARPYLDQALRIRKKALGEDHTSTATTLHNLGILELRLGNYAGTKHYYEQALAIRKKLLVDAHPAVATSLGDVGALLFYQGDYAEARRYCEQALAICRRNLDLAAVAQAERQQLLMIAQLRWHFDNYLDLPQETEKQTAAVYAEVLAWKGVVLARQQRLRVQHQHPQLGPIYDDLRITARQLANLAFAVPDPAKRAAWKIQLEELSERKEELERSLAQKSQAFRQEQQLQKLTAEQLCKRLPADSALIDFVVFRHRKADAKHKGRWVKEAHLTAFILKPGAAIVRQDLGPMASIEKAIDLWRTRTKERVLAEDDHPGMELRRRLWLPLQKHVAGAKTVLLSPDGALGRLPFAALPGSKEGSYLLEEVALSVVPVPRLLPELLDRERKEEKGAKPSLLLVGDVDFDAAAGKAGTEERVAAAGERSGERKHWKRLPATLGEILVIERYFKKRFKGAQVESLSEDQATEANLRDLASQYSYLHLATHGFFARRSVSSTQTDDVKERFAGELIGQESVAGFHPGLLSGLVLAGANKPPAPGQSDGILTALEVAELDLRKVELAVLSACETGLGKVAAGEGLLGLQRAFQVAGAKSVVASLWSVDDEATRKLMERFYENLWQKKMTRQESLRQAQLAMLRGDLGRGFVPDEQKQNPRLPPHYWAAFVLSGDWR